jgi:hypothetical protein
MPHGIIIYSYYKNLIDKARNHLRDAQDNNLPERRFGGEAAEPSSDFIWYFI